MCKDIFWAVKCKWLWVAHRAEVAVKGLVDCIPEPVPSSLMLWVPSPSLQVLTLRKRFSGFMRSLNRWNIG